MSLKIQAWGLLGLCIVLLLGGIVFFANGPLREVHSQIIDDFGIETTQLLADFVHFDESGHIQVGDFREAFEQFQLRPFASSVFGQSKTQNTVQAVITDAQGQVLFSSAPLLGQGEVSSFSAPIYHSDQISGTLTLRKAHPQLSQYLVFLTKDLLWVGLYVFAVTLLLCLLSYMLLIRPLNRLKTFNSQFMLGQRVEPPKFNNRELREIVESILSLRRSMEQRARKEEFFTSLAQELTEPLTELIEAADELELSVRDQRPKETTARQIREKSLWIHQILQRTLALVKVEGMRELTKTSQVVVASVFAKLQQTFAERSAKQGVQLKLNGPKNLVIEADPKLLEVALQNVLENAFEFSGPDSIIELHAQEKRGAIEFIIRDEGAGVPEFALPFVFQRFYSLPRQTNQVRGVGLGLALVKEIALLHKGKVVLNSPPLGKSCGTEVRINFPSEIKH